MILTHAHPIDTMSTADAVAAVPALLGHFPQETLCVMFLRAGRIAMLISADIDQNHTGFALHIARLAKDRDMDAVRMVLSASARRAGTGIAFADTVRACLEAHGTPVLSSAHAFQIQRGGIWTDLDTPDHGIIPDPATTAAAMHAVANGLTILEARADIQARYAPVQTPDFMARRAACLHSKTRGFASSALREVAELVRTNQYPPAALAARVSILVTIDPAARDALLGIGLIDMNAAAAAYIDIANQARGRARAHLLATAAALYYVSGRGVASFEAIRHALDAARTAKADNSNLMHLVTTAHERAIAPAFLRAFLAAGHIAATKYGVQVPEYTP